MKNGRTLPVVLAAIALTLLTGLVALNFTTGEKKIEHKVARLYAAGDPVFARAMGVFNADLARSRRISLDAWQQRPLAEKLLEHAASLIGGQL